MNEIVKTGIACFEAGAEAIHFHTRNIKGEHVLDSGLCKETLTELQKKVPKMHLQITTEAIGKYSPEEMRKLAYEVMPPGISIGIREMIPSRNPGNEDIKIYQKLIDKQIDVLLDDRDDRAGIKFKDADLIGIPWRIVVGREADSGLVELHNRKTKITESLDLSSVFEKLSIELNTEKL